MDTEFVPRICRDCDPPHVDNCTKCFGYGFHKGGMIVRAGEAKELTDSVTCSECFGNHTGGWARVTLEIEAKFLNGSGDGIPIGFLS